MSTLDTESLGTAGPVDATSPKADRRAIARN